jgi:DNA polymerase I-like protein with 3'-5' exonuclease and polymerase domains
MLKKAMLDVDAWIGRNNPDIKMIMQVHPEQFSDNQIF